MVIARLVAPEAYGLIAMINVFISFFQLFVNGGLASALIQKKDRKEIDFNTTFIANFLIAILLYVLMYLGAPYISKFYNQPEMTSMTRWVSITLILQSLSLIQKTRLTILLDFKTQAIASLISLILGAFLGITLAYNGYGVWALITQTLVGQTTSSLILAIVSKWVPKLQYSWISFKKLFSFGSKQLLTDIFTSFYINSFNLIIGKFYSPSSLAFYNRGFSLGFLPANLWTTTFSRISYPILCENQNSREDLLTQYYRYLSLGSYVLFPISFVIALYAFPIIETLLTQKWLPAAPYLIIMCFVFMIHPFNLTMGQVVNAIGQPDKNLKANLIKSCISFGFLIATVPFGVIWIAVGVLISTFIGVIISSYVSAHALNISIISQYKPLIKPLIACIIMSIIGMSFYLINNGILILISGIPFCLLTYIGLTYVMNIPEKKLISIYLVKLKFLKNGQTANS